MDIAVLATLTKVGESVKRRMKLAMSEREPPPRALIYARVAAASVGGESRPEATGLRSARGHGSQQGAESPMGTGKLCQPR